MKLKLREPRLKPSRMVYMKQHVTILGGGNGGSISIRALKHHLDKFDVSAIIAMSDSGSSSGKLRKELGVLPPGDILRAVLAMSRYDYELMKRIFYDTRYSEHGKLQGFGIGHLFIGLAEKYNGGIIDAIRALAQAVDVVGPVFPVTTESTDLCVELTNGDIVIGEHEIDRPTYSRKHRIQRAWLQPTPLVYERAREEILQADALIIGPGSFYTSIIATLLPEGVKDAIRESSAKIIYVANKVIDVEGETGPEQLSEFVLELEQYLPRPVDVVLYDEAVLGEKQLEQCRQKGWKEIVADLDRLKERKIVTFTNRGEETSIDPVVLGEVICEVMKN